MANIYVRVVLHGADEKDYDRLHEFMAVAGFQRQIVGDSGTTCELPRAMYYSQAYTTPRDARAAAREAARVTGFSFAVLAVAGSSAWCGLEEVD